MTMDALLPLTTAGPAPPDDVPPRPPGQVVARGPYSREMTPRMERYARGVAAGLSYADAFRQAGCVASTSGSMARQIGDLNKDPRIKARVVALREGATAEAVSTLAERMEWLRLIVQADPNELRQIVRDPCDVCWPDAEVARAYAAHFAAPSPFHEERPALPDTSKPRHDCPRCRGAGFSRVVLTPTDELSPAARALFKSASQDKDGVIKIEMHDQIAAADMLNKLQGAYIARSLNLNANVNVQAARDASPEDAMRLFDQFAPAT